MRLRLMILMLFLSQSPVAWSQSALEILGSEPVSRLDLAMTRLSQKVLEYRVEKLSQEYGAFELRSAFVRFNGKTNKIEFQVFVRADPTNFYCELALKDYMQSFYFGGTTDGAAKMFYSSFFMPANSPARSYEIALYESVFESTTFKAVVYDEDYNPTLECVYSGADPKIQFKKP